jgi:hypothetical protein
MIKFIISENKKNDAILKWVEKEYADLKFRKFNPTMIIYYLPGYSTAISYDTEFQLLTLSDYETFNFLNRALDVDIHDFKLIMSKFFKKKYDLPIRMVGVSNSFKR